MSAVGARRTRNTEPGLQMFSRKQFVEMHVNNQKVVDSCWEQFKRKRCIPGKHTQQGPLLKTTASFWGHCLSRASLTTSFLCVFCVFCQVKRSTCAGSLSLRMEEGIHLSILDKWGNARLIHIRQHEINVTMQIILQALDCCDA